MAHSLKIAGWALVNVLLTVLLAGCGMMPHTKTSAQRLDYVLSTQQKANAAYQADDMEHAAALYLQLTKMVPQEADYWYMLGNTYVRGQQPDEAVQAYQQAIVRNPNHTRAWHNLGIVRMRQATAAFVSSASTAKVDDPMHDISTKLADQLGRISSGEAGKPDARASATAPLPFTAAERLDPLTRVQHVRVSKPTATAGTAASPTSPMAGKAAVTGQP